MKKSKLVRVGNGMAGVRTLEELLKFAPNFYEITVFGAEPNPNKNRILLANNFKGVLRILGFERTMKAMQLLGT